MIDVTNYERKKKMFSMSMVPMDIPLIISKTTVLAHVWTFPI